MEFKLKDLTMRTVTYDDTNEVCRMWDFEKGEISYDEAVNAIEWMNSNHKLNQLHKITHMCFAIFENETNKIIGWCGLDGRNINTDGKVHIFYIIDRDYRRRGYATECARKILEYGFVNMKLDRIDGSCSNDNISSQKVMERIGMQRIEDDEDNSHNYFMTINDYNELCNN